jgi:hypothetical protein
MLVRTTAYGASYRSHFRFPRKRRLWGKTVRAQGRRARWLNSAVSGHFQHREVIPSFDAKRTWGKSENKYRQSGYHPEPTPGQPV